jgi:ABC-2 type transport system permease protein
MKSLRIWLLFTKKSFQQVISQRLTTFIFVLGKVLRIGLFVFFLLYLFKGAKGIGMYSSSQIIFFYLTFNLIEELSQFLFREVYRFRSLIIRGDFDSILVKPYNPLLKVLLGGVDFLDLVVLIFLIVAVIFWGTQYIHTTTITWVLYFGMIANAILLAASFHIFVLGLGVLTTSIDHLIMVYRDLSSLMRIPVDLYSEPIKFALTFIIPLGIMFTFPPKILMGLINIELIVVSVVLSFILFSGSLLFWNYSLKKYQSASS